MINTWLNWRWIFLLLSLIIISASIYFSVQVSSRLEQSEKNNVRIWAKSMMYLSGAEDMGEPESELLFEIIQSNNSIPVILTDRENKVLATKNIDTVGEDNIADFLQKEKDNFAAVHPPLELNYRTDSGVQIRNFVYYGESYLLRVLKYFPYLILGSVFFILATVLILLNREYKSTQNKLWLGMSKETAHQLGTPLTSLEGWIHLLAEKEGNGMETTEMRKDIDRLKLVVDRFSKIGSQPKLDETNINDRLEEMVQYMKLRSPQNVNIEFESTSPEIIGAIDPQLFSWVIENLIRNALDVLPGKGNIWVRIDESPQSISIEVQDDGEGISKENISKIFKPGFSTKKRGWGLGLSLSKRIIEQFHDGKLTVKQSAPGKGTSFLIKLKKQSTEDIRKK